MNAGQYIFLVFYAVLFGVMLTRLSGLHAFPWGFSYENRRSGARLVWRLLVSIACLYILPVIIFGLGYGLLDVYSRTDIPAKHAVLIALSSFSVFAPYRLYLLLAIVLRTGPFRLYSRESFEAIAEQRHIRRSVFGHLLSIAFFAGALLLLAWVANGGSSS